VDEEGVPMASPDSMVVKSRQHQATAISANIAELITIKKVIAR